MSRIAKMREMINNVEAFKTHFQIKFDGEDGYGLKELQKLNMSMNDVESPKNFRDAVIKRTEFMTQFTEVVQQIEENRGTVFKEIMLDYFEEAVQSYYSSIQYFRHAMMLSKDENQENIELEGMLRLEQSMLKLTQVIVDYLINYKSSLEKIKKENQPTGVSQLKMDEGSFQTVEELSMDAKKDLGFNAIIASNNDMLEQSLARMEIESKTPENRKSMISFNPKLTSTKNIDEIKSKSSSNLNITTQQELNTAVDDRIRRALEKQATTNFDHQIEVPNFGMKKLDGEVEKCFKARFSSVYYEDENNKSATMDIILRDFKDLIEDIGLAEETAGILMLRVLRGSLKTLVNTMMVNQRQSFSKLWLTLQSLGSTALLPSEAFRKIESLVQSIPPEMTLATALTEIINLSFVAHNDRNINEQNSAATLHARTSIVASIRNNYGYNIASSISSELNSYLRNRHAAGEESNGDVLTTLISITLRQAGNEPRKKLNRNTFEQNDKRNYTRYSESKSKKDTRINEIKSAPADFPTRTCFLCRYTGKIPKYEHQNYKQCPFYRNENPDFTKQCNNCGGYHRTECKRIKNGRRVQQIAAVEIENSNMIPLGRRDRSSSQQSAALNFHDRR